MILCFATNNVHKLQEVATLLPEGYELLSLQDIGCYQDIPETQDTIEGNARQKAAFVFERYQLNCFADDTGLEVEALHGAPGVLSARYAGPQKSDHDNCQKLLADLRTKDNRNARFRTVICLMQEGNPHFFEGIIKGAIVSEPRGRHGFGYDPLFQPMGFQKTFAEMTPHEKNDCSHRSLAVKKLIAYLNRK